MARNLTLEMMRRVAAPLSVANLDFARHYPGEPSARQPVHTAYEGAHLFRSDSARRHGELALASLREHAPDPATFARALGLPESGSLVDSVYRLVDRKLRTEPVEDLRLDFEDGYGNRPNEEEDGHAVSAAREVATGREKGALPAFIGLRIKPFTEELFERSARTLDIFLATLLEGGAPLPEGFVITLPKVTVPEQVGALADLLTLLEPRLGLPAGALVFEIMVETPQSIIGAEGRLMLPHLVAAGRGRCVSAHLGTYDYTAGVNITAAHQHMAHPACDFAKHMMQVALAGTGVMMSDGSTNVLPIGPHRAAEDGRPLTVEQLLDNRWAVHRAWKLHFENVRRSLVGAFYQGWDLHPAQLPARFAAVFSFYLESLPAASERLGNFLRTATKSAQSAQTGEVVDDAATGQALLNFFLRGVACGAISEAQVLATGITPDELLSRSFARILKDRRAAGEPSSLPA
jgi:citrate lyase beta subunit